MVREYVQRVKKPTQAGIRFNVSFSSFLHVNFDLFPYLCMILITTKIYSQYCRFLEDCNILIRFRKSLAAFANGCHTMRWRGNEGTGWGRIKLWTTWLIYYKGFGDNSFSAIITCLKRYIYIGIYNI